MHCLLISLASKILFINFAEHLQKGIILNKLNMRLPPNHLINRSLLLHIKPHLHPLKVSYPSDNIPRHPVYLRVFCFRNDPRRIVWHELVLGWWHQHHFLEPADFLAGGKPHQEWVLLSDWLEVQLLDVLDLVDLRQVPHSQVHQRILWLRHPQMRRCQRYQRLHHVPVLRQMLETRPCNYPAQTKTNECDPLDVLVRVD